MKVWFLKAVNFQLWQHFIESKFHCSLAQFEPGLREKDVNITTKVSSIVLSFEPGLREKDVNITTKVSSIVL